MIQSPAVRRGAKRPVARIKLSSGAGAILLAASSLAVAAAWVYGFPLWLDQQSLWNGWGFLAMAGGALFWLELSRRLIGHVWKSNSQIFAKRLACLVFVASVFNPIVCFWMADNSAGAAVIRFLQTMSLTNGVSLIPPALCLMIAPCLWSGFVLRRLWLAESSRNDLSPWCDLLPLKVHQNPLRAASDRMVETFGFLQELLTTGCHAMRRNFTAHFFLFIAGGGLWLAHLSR